MNTYSTHDDRTLVARLVAGSEAAEDEFLARIRSIIYGELRRSGLPTQDRDDVCQHVILRLCADSYRRVRLWRGASAGSLAPFIRTVTSNAVRDHYRREGRRPILTGDIGAEDTQAYRLFELPDDDPEERALRAERRRNVREALATLSRRDIDLLVRHFWNGEDYAEMSSALGMSVNNVGVAIHRARERLAARLQKTDPELYGEHRSRR